MYFENPPKVMESIQKIRFQDCDPFGHLANSRYIDCFFEARDQQVFDYYGFDFFEMSKISDCVWVSTENEIVYVKELRAKEIIVITTKTIKMTGLTSIVEFIMYNHDKTEIHAIMWGTVAYFNLKNRRLDRIPKKLSEYFKQVAFEVTEPTFKERVKKIKINQTNY